MKEEFHGKIIILIKLAFFFISKLTYIGLILFSSVSLNIFDTDLFSL